MGSEITPFVLDLEILRIQDVSKYFCLINKISYSFVFFIHLSP